jgi:ectoine hydroxylase-related dioxygenase (phytanoyl-CoA dioxygenase family)
MDTQYNERLLEALEHDGYCLLPECFDSAAAEEWGRRLELVYALQRREFGHNRLRTIGELGLVRAPLRYDPQFLDIALSEPVLAYVRNSIAGGIPILHSQNGFLYRLKNAPSEVQWHRGSPLEEQTAVTSKPIAICASFYLDDVLDDSCMYVLPGSHKCEDLPSKSFIHRNQTPIRASRGTVVLVNAMLFRRWSPGASRVVRLIEHTYTIPLIKAEINFAGPPHVQARASIDPLARTVLDIP